MSWRRKCNPGMPPTKMLHIVEHLRQRGPASAQRISADRGMSVDAAHAALRRAWRKGLVVRDELTLVYSVPNPQAQGGAERLPCGESLDADECVK